MLIKRGRTGGPDSSAVDMSVRKSNWLILGPGWTPLNAATSTIRENTTRAGPSAHVLLGVSFVRLKLASWLVPGCYSRVAWLRHDAKVHSKEENDLPARRRWYDDDSEHCLDAAKVTQPSRCVADWVAEGREGGMADSVTEVITQVTGENSEIWQKRPVSRVELM